MPLNLRSLSARISQSAARARAKLILDGAGKEAVVDELRTALSDDQRQILTAIWRYHLKNDPTAPGDWISDRRLLHLFGNSVTFVQDAIHSAPISGSILLENEYASPRGYRLTHLGILLTENGARLEDLLVRYLAYLVRVCQTDPDLIRVADVDIAHALGLDTDQLGDLHAILWATGQFWDGGSWGGDTWTATVPRDIAALFDVEDLGTYVRRRILQPQSGYDPDLPIDEHGRQTYSSRLAQQQQTESEFWFVRHANLKANLIRDWTEARNAYTVGATKACIILCGGICEGLFLDALSEDTQRAQSAYAGKFGKSSKRKLDRWDLGELADVAQQLNLLSDPTLFPLSDVLRQWRDLVHPGRELRTAITITEHKAATSINTVATCIQDFSARAVGSLHATGSQGSVIPQSTV